jgi:hypothetical protein
MPEMSSAPPPEPSRVIWCRQARIDLELVVEDPAVRQILPAIAENILREIEDRSAGEHVSKELAADEGRAGEIMWVRACMPAQRRHADGEPEDAEDSLANYILFFRKAPGPAEFEVLAVRCNRQVAERWEQMNSGDC